MKTTYKIFTFIFIFVIGFLIADELVIIKKNGSRQKIDATQIASIIYKSNSNANNKSDLSLFSDGFEQKYDINGIDSIVLDIVKKKKKLPFNSRKGPAGMKYIKGGIFTMGDEKIAKPSHIVAVSDFWMDSTEVIQKDYSNLMNVHPWNDYAGNYSGGIADNKPAWYVNWFDAVLYCNARSKKFGLDTVYTYDIIKKTPGNDCELKGLKINYNKIGFRLPTEAEWEYACISGRSTEYYWGKNYNPYPQNRQDTTNFNKYAVWYGNSFSYGGLSPEYGVHKVATKAPNKFQLYDMSGNVWEWCNDWYNKYSEDMQTDPKGPSRGQFKVFHGGSWGNHSGLLRAAFRSYNFPDLRFNLTGFRCVLPIR